jgi:hypothetical protein
MLRASVLVIVGLAVVACIGESDIQEALKRDLENGRAGSALCGTKSGEHLTNVTVTDVTMTDTTGTARATGVPGAGKPACTGTLSFRWVKARSVTQGVNGQSESYVAFLSDFERK